MRRWGERLLRVFGVMLMLSALAFAASKAPDRKLETLIERWAPAPSDFIDLDGQLVHLRDEGPRDDPQPLVLIHGTSASLHTWQGWVAELARTRRVITFDLPGFGLTGPATGAGYGDDYSDEAYIAFVDKLLTRLRLPAVVLGGNSLGGQVAWEYASFHPTKVAALILVDAGGHAFVPESIPLGFQLARIPLVKHLSRFVMPRSVVEKSVRNVYGDPAKVNDLLIERYFEMALREGNRAALVKRFGQLEPGKFVPRLAGLKQPTLILWGGRDRLIPPEYGLAFARDIKGARHVQFDALGHVPQEEDPAATVKPVLEFLHTLKP